MLLDAVHVSWLLLMLLLGSCARPARVNHQLVRSPSRLQNSLAANIVAHLVRHQVLNIEVTNYFRTDLLLLMFPLGSAVSSVNASLLWFQSCT